MATVNSGKARANVILVQCRRTGRYLCGDGSWSFARSSALQFPTVKQARASAESLRLVEVDALVFRGVHQIIPVRVRLTAPSRQDEIPTAV
jgi:hypothetical protein